MIRRLLPDRFRRLADDQRGTSLTEFAICTPIFVMVLSFVYYVGAAGWVMTDQSAQARKGLLEEVVIPAQQPQQVPTAYNDPSQRNAHPPRAAEIDEQHLAEHGIPQKREELAGELRQHEEATYQGLASNGHWGESYQRSDSVDGHWEFTGRADHLTDEPQDVIGESAYAESVVDDTDSAPTVQMNANDPAILQGSSVFAGSSVNGNGRVPTLGAGLRYGVDHYVERGEVTLGQWELEVMFTREVLVPPRAYRTNAEERATRVARHQLDQQPAYSELLGIEMDETIPQESAPSVPNWDD